MIILKNVPQKEFLSSDVAPRFARAAGEEWKETRTNSRRRVTSNTPPHFKSTRSTPTSQLSRDGGMQRTKSNMSITSACASPAPVQKWNLNFDAPKHKTPAAKSSLVENSGEFYLKNLFVFLFCYYFCYFIKSIKSLLIT